MTERDAILDFEREAWKLDVPKERAIRERFGFSAARYHQLLHRIVDGPTRSRTTRCSCGGSGGSGRAAAAGARPIASGSVSRPARLAACGAAAGTTQPVGCGR